MIIRIFKFNLCSRDFFLVQHKEKSIIFITGYGTWLQFNCQYFAFELLCSKDTNRSFTLNKNILTAIELKHILDKVAFYATFFKDQRPKRSTRPLSLPFYIFCRSTKVFFLKFKILLMKTEQITEHCLLYRSITNVLIIYFL